MKPSVPAPGPPPERRSGSAQAEERLAEAESLLGALEAGDVATDPTAQAAALETVHEALQDAMRLAEG